MNYDWLDTAKKLQAIAQTGLTYCKDKFDRERYETIRELSVEIMSHYIGLEMGKIKSLFANETGYQTPKVDIRGVIFKEDKILLVKEKIDGCWTPPGGWADIGLTPAEVVVKEIKEEAGLICRAIKLLAVLDKKMHKHPPDAWHVYKMFILCEVLGGEVSPGMETSDAGYFSMEELPELSIGRITKEQIKMLFEYHKNPSKPVIFD